MLLIQDTIVSPDLTEEYFCCDLAACKGTCCVEGESGAPVEESETANLESVLPVVWDDLSNEARQVIKRQGVVYLDADGEYVTSIVNGKDCIFTCYDEQGICRCAIEKAYREGRTGFRKPVSCHLYPVRVTQYKHYRAVNYHRWAVCDAAREYGRQSGTKVYRFLKEPLIRKFGAEWYRELETLNP
jgi:hypothetical protein